MNEGYEENCHNSLHYLSPSKASLISLFVSHLFSSLFNFIAEETASLKGHHLSLG
jgi:hypothetical protein